MEVSGHLVAHVAVGVGSLALDGGNIAGSGIVTVTNSFKPSNATINGHVSIASGVIWSVNSGYFSLGDRGQLTNAGTGTLDPSTSVYISSFATLTNSGTLTMDDGSELYGGNDVCGYGEFDNTGILDVDPGSSQTAYVCAYAFDNSGAIELNSGILDDEGTINLNSGSSITGSGSLEVSGSLGVNAAVSVGTLMLKGGEIAGSATLAIAGSFTATNGTIDGDVSVDSDATWSVTSGQLVIGFVFSDGKDIVDGQLTSAGTGIIDASADIFMQPFGASSLTNSGTLTMDDSASINGGSDQCDGEGTTDYGTFDNTGTLDVDPGGSLTAYLGNPDCGLTVDNTGTIEITSGILDDEGIISLNSGSSITGPARWRFRKVCMPPSQSA